eukprot:jgi/Mesvir1/26501/Mv16161-RA.4
MDVVVSELVREKERHPSRPILIICESFGAVLTLAVALEPAVQGLLAGLVLVNPATSVDRTPLPTVLPLLMNLDDAVRKPVYAAAPTVLLPFVGRALDVAAGQVEDTARDSLRDFASGVINELLKFGGLVQALPDLLPPETWDWRMLLLTDAVRRVNPLLPTVRVKTLVLASTQDLLLPSVEEGERLRQVMPNCQVVKLPSSGHAALMEDGVDVLRIMEQSGFLEATLTTHAAPMAATRANQPRPTAHVGEGSLNGTQQEAGVPTWKKLEETLARTPPGGSGLPTSSHGANASSNTPVSATNTAQTSTSHSATTHAPDHGGSDGHHKSPGASGAKQGPPSGTAANSGRARSARTTDVVPERLKWAGVAPIPSAFPRPSAKKVAELSGFLRWQEWATSPVFLSMKVKGVTGSSRSSNSSTGIDSDRASLGKPSGAKSTDGLSAGNGSNGGVASIASGVVGSRGVAGGHVDTLTSSAGYADSKSTSTTTNTSTNTATATTTTTTTITTTTTATTTSSSSSSSKRRRPRVIQGLAGVPRWGPLLVLPDASMPPQDIALVVKRLFQERGLLPRCLLHPSLLSSSSAAAPVPDNSPLRFRSVLFGGARSALRRTAAGLSLPDPLALLPTSPEESAWDQARFFHGMGGLPLTPANCATLLRDGEVVFLCPPFPAHASTSTRATGGKHGVGPKSDRGAYSREEWNDLVTQCLVRAYAAGVPIMTLASSTSTDSSISKINTSASGKSSGSGGDGSSSGRNGRAVTRAAGWLARISPPWDTSAGTPDRAFSDDVAGLRGSGVFPGIDLGLRRTYFLFSPVTSLTPAVAGSPAAFEGQSSSAKLLGFAEQEVVQARSALKEWMSKHL